MAMIPLAMAAIPAVLGGIGGILDIIGSAKRLHEGGRLRKHYKKKGGAVHKRRHAVHHRKAYKHKRGGAIHRKRMHKHRRKLRGKGVLADIVGKIPLLGSLAGPLISMLGGKLRRHRKGMHKKRRGHGLAPMRQYKPYLGRGLSPMYQYRPYLGGMLLPPGGPTMPHGYGGLLSLPGSHQLARGYTPASIATMLTKVADITTPAMRAGVKGSSKAIQLLPRLHSMLPKLGLELGSLGSVGSPSITPVANALARLHGAPATGYGLRRRRHVKKHKRGGAVHRKKVHHRKHHYKGRGHVIRLPLIGNVATSMLPKFLRGGLLAPAGGAVHRRGHMRKVPGRAAKVHVRATVVKKGGYMPYRW